MALVADDYRRAHGARAIRLGVRREGPPDRIAGLHQLRTRLGSRRLDEASTEAEDVFQRFAGGDRGST
jgi:hypothetical protein